MSAKIEVVNRFDNVFYVKDLVQEILGPSVKIDEIVDSIMLFNVVTKDGPTI